MHLFVVAIVKALVFNATGFLIGSLVIVVPYAYIMFGNLSLGISPGMRVLVFYFSWLMHTFIPLSVLKALMINEPNLLFVKNLLENTSILIVWVLLYWFFEYLIYSSGHWFVAILVMNFVLMLTYRVLRERFQ